MESRARRNVFIAVAVPAVLLLLGIVHAALDPHPMRAYRMPSEAMSPTLLPGDYFLVDLSAYRHHAPARGDIVIYPYPVNPRQMFVKRVVGLPNESIEIRDKQVWLDGRPLPEPQVVHIDPTVLPAARSPRDNFSAVTIGPEDVFVMGDNRDNSADSRFMGTVPLRELRGKATVIYLSLGRDGARWDRIGRRLDR